MLVRPSFIQVRHVAQNLRALDAREAAALRYSDDPDALAFDVCNMASPRWCATIKGVPVYVLGCAPGEGGAWAVWGFGTDLWPQVAYEVSHFIKRVLIPAMSAHGIKTVECLSLADKVDAHRWLKWLGAEEIATDDYVNYGRTGENFKLFVWR